MRSKRSSRGPLHLEIYAGLKSAVISGELPPGSVVSEAEVARRWAASRTPVREALRQLELDDLISWTPRRGATVARLSIGGLRDIFELRECLETTAARLASERAREGDVAELKQILEAIDSAHRAGDIGATIELDDGFHRRIALSSGNVLLAGAADRLLDRVRAARSMARHIPGRQEEFQREHRAVLDAIAAHDAGAAEEAIRLHVQRSRVRLLELLEQGAPRDAVAL